MRFMEIGILVRIVGLCRVPVASFQMRRLSLASTDGETGREVRRTRADRATTSSTWRST